MYNTLHLLLSVSEEAAAHRVSVMAAKGSTKAASTNESKPTTKSTTSKNTTSKSSKTKPGGKKPVVNTTASKGKGKALVQLAAIEDEGGSSSGRAAAPAAIEKRIASEKRLERRTSILQR